MTYDEFKKFVAETLYVSFPSLREWVTNNSPDMAGTHRSWFKTLEPFSVSEVEKIISDWQTGRKEPFKPYERDLIAIKIRANVEFDRQAANRARSNLELTKAHIERVANSRATYIRSKSLAEVWAQGEDVIDRWKRGELTEDEWKLEVERVSKMAGETS